MRSTLLLPVLFFASTLASFAPSRSACPPGAEAKVRLAGSPFTGNQTLNSLESDYITQRRLTKIPGAIKSFLGARAKKVFGGDLDRVAPLDLPVIGISMAGGGLRASIVTAGFLKGMDAREEEAMRAETGGLLQSASYLTALSGGSWTLSSLIFNNYPRIDALVFGDGGSQTGWGLAGGIFPSDRAAGVALLTQLLGDLSLKVGAGFPVTFVDLWGRALARRFLPGTTVDIYLNPLAANGHGVDITYSSISTLPLLKSFDLPLPIITAKGYTTSIKETAPLAVGLAPLSAVTYETTPFEFGSFDPELSAFYPTKFIGSSLSAGSPSSPVCVTGYDKATFVFGASSALFNAFNVTNNPDWDNPAASLGQSWRLVNSTFYPFQPNQQIDIAPLPNPFLDVAGDTYEDSKQTQLRLANGAIDGLGDPLSPLIVKARALDVIVIIAAASDTTEFKPSGLSLVLTQLRSSILRQGATVLPPIPQSVNTFLAQGLNVRPTFFGCNAAPSKLTGGKSVTAAYPLIVYLPNADPSGTTNTSTLQQAYPDTQTRAMITASAQLVHNGFPLPGQSNDPEWGTALGCAVMERTRAKLGIDRTADCERLFGRYCWNELEGPIATPVIPAKNLMPFKGAINGILPPAVYLAADNKTYRIEGKEDKYDQLKVAQSRSCAIQHQLGDENLAKLGKNAKFTGNDLQTQEWNCKATFAW